MSKKPPPESRYVPDEATGSTRHLDLAKMRRAEFPNLKPTNATISLRMPVWMLHEIKRRANQRDVPYQSFIKMMLAEGLEAKPARRRAAGL
ncbi:MAG TPA: CopG family antitoxin [Tepidisphaeraceae bacterium]|nr:CopG family antitoxin [Tepidisphaeraceae bacterium]